MGDERTYNTRTNYTHDHKRGIDNFYSDSRRTSDRYSRRNEYTNRRSDYPERRHDDFGGRKDNDWHRGDRYRRTRYNNDRYDYRRSEDRFRRGEYGPKLNRELDSSYDEKVNRNYANSVFIGNLTYDTTPDDLNEFFSQIGEVVRADIITSRGHHRGMGTVEFTNNEDVGEAIRRFDRSIFMNREIFVRQDNPPPQPFKYERDRMPSSRRKAQEGYEVFIARLPYSINWQSLKDMFRECGDVFHAEVSLDRDGYSRGFGTVYMATKDSQQAAIEKWNGFEMEGRTLDVREGRVTNDLQTIRDEDNASDDLNGSNPDVKEFAQSDFTRNTIGGGEGGNIVFCENMPLATAQTDLYDLFETIGKVVRAELKYNSEENLSRSSVCEFENPEDAATCIERLNNYNYGGCVLKISYAKIE